MTDKVQKIREEVERLRNLHQIKYQNLDTNDNMCLVECGKRNLCNELLSFIDSLQEEPTPKFKVGDTIRNIYSGELFHIEKVDSRNYWDGRDSFYIIHQDCWELVEEPISEFLNTESMIESYKQRLISQANGMKNSPFIDMCLVSYKHGINETLDTLNLSNVQRTVKDWKEEPIIEVLDRYLDRVPDEEVLKTKMAINEWFNEYFPKLEPVSEDLEEAAEKASINAFFVSPQWTAVGKELFKAGAEWQKAKDESVIQDLGEYINELSKQFPEVSFAKLSRIAVRVAKWQKEKDLMEKEYVSKDLEETAEEYTNDDILKPWRNLCKGSFISGAKWQMAQMIKDSTDVTVHIDAGNYPYIPQIELYDYDKDVPLAKECDKYKVVLIKED